MLKKRDNRPKMESLVLGPTSANQDLILNLIAVSAFQNVTFNLSPWNYLVRSSEIIHPMDPFCFPLEGDLAGNNAFFANNFFFSASSLH